jgi:hyperosmotically inducible protein
MGRARAFLLGAGATYFLDPARGRRRRHVLRDRSLRAVRRTGRLSSRKARFGLGRLRGLGARMHRKVLPGQRALDDRTVEQRIRSEVLREVGLGRQDVDVRVEQGIVTLRGHVGGRSLADDLIGRVRSVPGVVDVAAMLRVTADA